MSNEAYKKYKSDLGEDAFKIVLGAIGKIELKKIPPKKDSVSPDFEVRNLQGELIAVCEVKSLVNPLYGDFKDIAIESDQWNKLMIKRDANHRSKLRKKLGEGIKQLKKYSNLPTILAFASFDMTDYIDMARVLQENLKLHPDNTMPDIFILMKIHQSIEPSKNFEIKETIMLMHNTPEGDVFGKQYLDWKSAIEMKGALPLKFNLS